jgi:broad specificity phosphatase PhoE
MPHTKDTPRAPVPVYLVRHGVTPWNRDGLIQGWTDIPLSEVGRLQALRLGMALSKMRFGRVITSTLGRARETADAIAGHQGTEVEVFSELREYSCGEWEGRPYLEVRSTERERFWAWFNDPDIPMPGGESMTQASARAVPVVRRVLEEMSATATGPLLIVAHGGINRLIAAHLLGMDLETAKRMRLDNASLSIFEPFLGAYALKLWNSVAHLDGLDEAEEGPTASKVG